jgi:hypothetical protein
MAWLTVLGIPAAVYVVCVAALMRFVNENSQDTFMLVGTGLLTMGIYIFHRTTVISVEPMQKRHQLSFRHRRVLLLFSFALLLFALIVFALHNPLAMFLVVGALLGVTVYGRKCISLPLRNVTYLKPFAVGISIALLAWSLNGFHNSTLTTSAFVLICSADALICDLVDRDYDKTSGCITLAQKLGSVKTWGVSLFLYVISVVILNAPVGWIFLALFPIPIFAKPVLRTAVDLRPLLVLLIAWSL